MEAITVHYKLSEKEYLDAARLIFFPKPTELKVRAASACVLFPVGIFGLALGAGFELLPALVIALALMPLLVYLFCFHFAVIARRCYKGDRKFRDALTVTFSDEHITVQSKHIESKQSWELYTDVLEGETCYALIYGKDIRMASMIPKRAFRSKKQHMAFRELIGAQFTKTLPVLQVGGDVEETEREYQPASLEPPDWR
ncbi:MAG TPA: YcxB family protein [Pyrinomonadaceae bacterium]|nr:YcxB family protein [Pyrinomonadaceae bacterium]